MIRCRPFDRALALEAVETLCQGKWQRNDILCMYEEWAGIPRRAILLSLVADGRQLRRSAADDLATTLEQLVSDIQEGHPPDLAPVSVTQRRDGMTGKVRDIAYLEPLHQLLGHVAALMLRPLLDARITPWQHASLPGRGQTGLARQVRRLLRKRGVRCSQKTDIHHAYASTRYDLILEQIQREVPRARLLHALLRFLAAMAPGGCLIIGGYLDAWLFNLVISYALRDVMQSGRMRRGIWQRDVICATAYMDDVALHARSPTALHRAVKHLTGYMARQWGLEVRTTTGIIRYLDADDERARKSAKHGRRGCPRLDMGGYVIGRTHMIMRPRVAIRAIRAYDRAYREITVTGTLTKQRAQAIMAYNSFVRQTDSAGYAKKHHVGKVNWVAKQVVGYWGRVDTKRRKERIIHDLQRRQERLTA